MLNNFKKYFSILSIILLLPNNTQAAQLDLRAEQARKKAIYEEMKKNPNLEYIKVNF